MPGRGESIRQNRPLLSNKARRQDGCQYTPNG
jgi:hypothetical protein